MYCSCSWYSGNGNEKWEIYLKISNTLADISNLLAIYDVRHIAKKKYEKLKKGKTEVFQVYSWYIGKYWKLIRKFQNNKIMKSGLHENISWYLGYWWDIVLTGPCQYRFFWSLKPSDQVQRGHLYQWE